MERQHNTKVNPTVSRFGLLGQILAPANQTTRYQLIAGSMTITKRQETTGINEDVERREPLNTIGGNVNGYLNSLGWVLRLHWSRCVIH